MVLETLPPLRSSSVMLPCWPADVGLTDNIQKRRMKEERGPSSARRPPPLRIILSSEHTEEVEGGCGRGRTCFRSVGRAV